MCQKQLTIIDKNQSNFFGLIASQKGAKNANFVQGGLSKPPAPFGRVNAGNDKKLHK